MGIRNLSGIVSQRWEGPRRLGLFTLSFWPYGDFQGDYKDNYLVQGKQIVAFYKIWTLGYSFSQVKPLSRIDLKSLQCYRNGQNVYYWQVICPPKIKNYYQTTDSRCISSDLAMKWAVLVLAVYFLSILWCVGDRIFFTQCGHFQTTGRTRFERIFSFVGW